MQKKKKRHENGREREDRTESVQRRERRVQGEARQKKKTKSTKLIALCDEEKFSNIKRLSDNERRERERRLREGRRRAGRGQREERGETQKEGGSGIEETMERKGGESQLYTPQVPPLQCPWPSVRCLRKMSVCLPMGWFAVIFCSVVLFTSCPVPSSRQVSGSGSYTSASRPRSSSHRHCQTRRSSWAR